MNDIPILSYVIWISITVLVYIVCVMLINVVAKKIAIPKITGLYIASFIIIGIVVATNTSYKEYGTATRSIVDLLFPATVALAIPMYRNRKSILRNLPEIAIATIVASSVSIFSIYALAKIMGFEDILIKSIISKCVTTPIAVEITKMIGGIEGIAVCAVCITGIFGAFCGHFITKKLKIKSDLSIGLAIGATSHMIGVTKCLEKSQKQAAIGAIVVITAAILSTFICAAIF